MPFLQKLGRTVDTLFGSPFESAAQDREMHKLRTDQIRHQMLRQDVADSIDNAKGMAALMQVSHPMQDGDRVQYNLNNPQQMQGVSGFMPNVQVDRPINPTRRMDLELGDKRRQSIELMGPDELHQRNLQQSGDRIRMELGKYSAQQHLDDASRLDREMALLHERERAERSAPPKVMFNTPTIDPQTGRVTLNIVKSDGSMQPIETGSSNPGFVTTKMRVEGQANKKGKAAAEKKPTITDQSDEFIQRVMQESNAKGGTRPEDYLRNVEQFYDDVRPAVKAKAKTYFRQQAKDAAARSKSNTDTTGTKTAAPTAAKVDLEYDMATGQFKKAR